MTTTTPPWYRQPLDLVLVVTFGMFALTSFLFDRLGGIDAIDPASADPLARALVAYGERFDPLVLENPVFLRIMSWISAFVMGPFYLVLIYAFVRRRNWIRDPAIAYAAIMLYSMVVHVAAELMWHTPPPNLPVLFATYAWYAVAPVLLLVRMRPTRPFG